MGRNRRQTVATSATVRADRGEVMNWWFDPQRSHETRVQLESSGAINLLYEERLGAYYRGSAYSYMTPSGSIVRFEVTTPLISHIPDTWGDHPACLVSYARRQTARPTGSTPESVSLRGWIFDVIGEKETKISLRAQVKSDGGSYLARLLGVAHMKREFRRAVRRCESELDLTQSGRA